jgi:transcriptional regulator with XRE-family HTH domain
MDRFVSGDDLKLIVSKKLQQLREKSQKTLEETARELNLDVTQYIRLLRGVRLPRLDTMININKVYGLSLDWWFSEVYGKPAKDEAIVDKSLEVELVENFKGLNTVCKEVVLSMITNLNKNQQRLKKLVSKYKQ